MNRWVIALTVGVIMAVGVTFLLARFTSQTLGEKRNLAEFNVRMHEADQFRLDLADFIGEFRWFVYPMVAAICVGVPLLIARLLPGTRSDVQAPQT